MKHGNYFLLRSRTIKRIAAFLIVFGLCLTSGAGVLAGSMAQSADEGSQLFEQYCQACHTIGSGVLVGPDLEGVTQRRERSWLVDFISRPDQMIASGDPLAVELLAKYKNVPMPNFGLSNGQVESILAFLESGAGAGTDVAAAVDLSGGDFQRGRALFNGSLALTNGGTACIACHSVQGASPLGGGSLGPDLTQVYTRLGDPGLASALVGLPFPTMQGIFNTRPLTTGEQSDLYAFLVDADGQPARAQNSTAVWFWVTGALGALLLLGIMALLWPRQRKSISAQLRESA